MKHSLLLLCALLFVTAVPPTAARADDSVPIDFFYDALSPYGDWIYTPNYGYIWQPLVAQQSNWAPYADGYWAYTDAGWTWISNEDFGWATYHYGRWIRLQQNWFWVPGYEWAPAWVSWRQTQGQIGWAPLPPEAAWAPNIGFGAWTDSYYDVGPAYYNFVPNIAFASSTSLLRFILDRSRNFNYYDQSVNITNITYRQNVMHNIFVGGPDLARINRFGSNQVRRLTLRRDNDSFRRDWLNYNGGRPRGTGSLSRIEKNQLVVAAPSIRRDGSRGMPARVRENLQQPVIDRGWRGTGDTANMNRVREQQRNDLSRTRPQQLPEKTRRPATSTMPPPAVGRVLNPEERKGGMQRPATPGNTPRPDVPRSDARPSGQPGEPASQRPNSGFRPGDNKERRGGAPMQPTTPPAPGKVENRPPEPQPRVKQPTPTPPQAIPQPPNMRPGFPGNREQRPGRSPQQRVPTQPSSPARAPTPPQRPQQPAATPSAPQGSRGPQNFSRRERKP